MLENVKCPKCGSYNVEEDDCFDTEHGCLDTEQGWNDTFIELYCGHCEDCGHDFQWRRVYIFVGYEMD